MRAYILNFLKNLSAGGKEVTEEDIINWANGKVKAAGKTRQMKEFKDKDLADSLYIFDLLFACQSESVNFSLVSDGSDDEKKLNNAKYAISCARKMGATTFLLPEDIVEVNPKMMMTYFGAIMSVYAR